MADRRNQSTQLSERQITFYQAHRLWGHRAHRDQVREDITHQTCEYTTARPWRLQAILDANSTDLNISQGAAGARRVHFWDGFRHILAGPDILCLTGSCRLESIDQAVRPDRHRFYASPLPGAPGLATLRIVTSPEPAVALTMCNCRRRQSAVHEGRDVRVWIALAFGFIHGFSVAGAIRPFDESPHLVADLSTPD